MISDLQKAYLKRYHGDEHLSKFLPPRWRQKSTGIDKKRLLRHCHRMNTLHDDKVRNRGLRQRSAADSSGVTSHRQPPQYRGAQGPKTAMGAQSDPNYVSKLSLDCVPVFHKIITPAYLLYRSGNVKVSLLVWRTRYSYTFCNAIDCRFELALEVQRWTRARSECLPGGGKHYTLCLKKTRHQTLAHNFRKC